MFLEQTLSTLPGNPDAPGDSSLFVMKVTHGENIRENLELCDVCLRESEGFAEGKVNGWEEGIKLLREVGVFSEGPF